MTTETASRTPVADLWSRILEDPRFDDLPYKVETNEHGQIILSPHKARHSYRQGDLVRLLSIHVAEGRIAIELAVQTSRGVKVPDVTWASEERYLLSKDAEPSPVAPELIIEVLSESNTKKEMDEKRELYFAGGAREVWTCEPEGRMRFFGPGSELPESEMVPSFPKRID